MSAVIPTFALLAAVFLNSAYAEDLNFFMLSDTDWKEFNGYFYKVCKYCPSSSSVWPLPFAARSNRSCATTGLTVLQVVVVRLNREMFWNLVLGRNMETNICSVSVLRPTSRYGSVSGSSSRYRIAVRLEQNSSLIVLVRSYHIVCWNIFSSVLEIPRGEEE